MVCFMLLVTQAFVKVGLPKYVYFFYITTGNRITSDKEFVVFQDLGFIILRN